MANKIGVEVTDFIKQTVEANHSSSEQKIISEEFAIQQTRELESNGFDNFHYYTLNDSRIIINIADDLGFYSLTK